MQVDVELKPTSTCYMMDLQSPRSALIFLFYFIFYFFLTVCKNVCNNIFQIVLEMAQEEMTVGVDKDLHSLCPSTCWHKLPVTS